MSPQYANRLESLALLLSGLCLFHCLGLPLLLIAIPALAAVLTVPESVHFYLVITALPLSVIVLVLGRRQHKSFIPLAMGIIGLLFMTAALTEQYRSDEITLTVIGATILALAHIINWKRRSRCAVGSGIWK
ncbi:MerC domain-containing protein [Parasphingorhabdus cellanae]|uniref:MerC domain-containing protein n=1 Tax=Parasphingorhabdus cellanae TaxID=2806553 RepID=A0ABX7T7X9_9SPHN|nr:MerC domain-containing protein [Parasphingorhabdus cellanae]QTD56887.1 MerC domain-containing protein [Parasphingorhabdus cellanae]